MYVIQATFLLYSYRVLISTSIAHTLTALCAVLCAAFLSGPGQLPPRFVADYLSLVVGPIGSYL